LRLHCIFTTKKKGKAVPLRLADAPFSAAAGYFPPRLKPVAFLFSGYPGLKDHPDFNN
jgi:hypothetical protein